MGGVWVITMDASILVPGRSGHLSYHAVQSNLRISNRGKPAGMFYVII